MGRRVALVVALGALLAGCKSPKDEARELSAEVPKPRAGSVRLAPKDPPKGFQMAKDGRLMPKGR